MITGAFLAESASAVDNKLTVSGGVLSRYVVGPERAAKFILVVLTQTETDNPVRLVSVEIRPPTGDEPRTLECVLPESVAGDEIGFAFFDVDAELPVDGRWVIVVRGGTGTVSLPLQVSS